MSRAKNRSVAKLRRSGRRAQDSHSTSRLAEMSARIDSARDSSLVRKPVFDRALDVVAYEAVLGGGPITDIVVRDEGRLTANSVIDLDIAGLGAGKPLHLPLSSATFSTGIPAELSPDQVMLFLGSGADAAPATVAALEDLRAKGFRVVLDDLATNAQLRPLLRLADAVKVNVGVAGPAAAKRVAVLKTSGVEIIADGIGSYEELRNATRTGFTQFQGSFLSRPDGFGKTRAPDAQLAALELITLLQNPDADISDIAELIRRDVGLSYRILKVVNSAHYSLARPLGSVEEAVMLVGTKQIVSWVGMLTMSGMNDKPSELTRSAMVRARTCETLAECLSRTDVQRFYIVGLFSVIDALLDVPAEKALGRLPLNTEIVDAIVSGGGVMGEVLRGVVAYERGEWSRAHIVGIEDEALSDAFHLAILETDRAWSQITGAQG